MKNIGGLSVKIGERIYHFVCDVDAPLGEIHDAISRIKGFIVERINQTHQAEKQPEGQDEQRSDSID